MPYGRRLPPPPTKHLILRPHKRSKPHRGFITTAASHRARHPSAEANPARGGADTSTPYSKTTTKTAQKSSCGCLKPRQKRLILWSRRETKHLPGASLRRRLSTAHDTHQQETTRRGCRRHLDALRQENNKNRAKNAMWMSNPPAPNASFFATGPSRNRTSTAGSRRPH